MAQGVIHEHAGEHGFGDRGGADAHAGVVPAGGLDGHRLTLGIDGPAGQADAGGGLERDRNRAAVIVWSMANETPVSEARQTFLKRLIEHARGLDSTRLISAAMERHYLSSRAEPGGGRGTAE